METAANRGRRKRVQSLSPCAPAASRALAFNLRACVRACVCTQSKTRNKKKKRRIATYKPSPPTRARTPCYERRTRATTRLTRTNARRLAHVRHVVDVQVYVSRAHMRRLVYLANAIPELFICLLPGSQLRENASLYVRANTPRELRARGSPRSCSRPTWLCCCRTRTISSLLLSFFLFVSLSYSLFVSRALLHVRPLDLWHLSPPLWSLSRFSFYHFCICVSLCLANTLARDFVRVAISQKRKKKKNEVWLEKEMPQKRMRINNMM